MPAAQQNVNGGKLAEQEQAARHELATSVSILSVFNTENHLAEAFC